MKAFLLAKRGMWDYHFGWYSMNPICIVLAKSPAEMAEICGGQYLEEWRVIKFSEECFTPTKEDREHFRAGELLEYRRGPFYFARFPEERAVLYVYELPFLQAQGALS